MFWFGARLLRFVFCFNCSLMKFDLSQEQVEKGPSIWFASRMNYTSGWTFSNKLTLTIPSCPAPFCRDRRHPPAVCLSTASTAANHTNGPTAIHNSSFLYWLYFRFNCRLCFYFSASSPVPIQPKEVENPSLEQPDQQQTTELLQTSRSYSSLNGIVLKWLTSRKWGRAPSSSRRKRSRLTRWPPANSRARNLATSWKKGWIILISN